MRLNPSLKPVQGLLLALFVTCLPAHAQSAAACAPGADNAPGGAYRTASGAVISVLHEGAAGAAGAAGAPGQWRITHFDSGRSHKLHPTQGLMFRSAADWNSEHPAALAYEFKAGADGRVEALTIEGSGAPRQTARRIALHERVATFMSGDVALSGTLTLPASGSGPFKAVIFVHGSDPVPSAGREWLPHLLASNGIATLVFDKRGTGCSKGQYTQHFGVLSDDVVAAAAWLRKQPDISGQQIGLAGFSQGGWVAPLAALKDPSVKFVAVAYGLAMSMADEDRLEAPLKLKEAGVDAAGLAEFEQLNAALHQVARDEFKDWAAFEQLLERYKDRPWLALAARQPIWLGVFMQMGLAQAKVAAPQMFKHFFQPFYEPVPTLEKLNQPMLWLIAGQDIEAPPGPTLAALARLRAQGKPVSVVVFANADHGMQEFEVRDGKRVRMKYADNYFSTLLKWLREQR